MTAHRVATYFLLGLFVLSLALAVKLFLPFLGELAIATTLAVVLRPLHFQFMKRGVPEGLSAALVVLIVLIAIMIPLVVFSISLFQEARDLLYQLAEGQGNIGGIYAEGVARVAAIFPELNVSLSEIASSASQWIVTGLQGFFSTAAKAFLGLFITMLGLYYVLKDGKYIRTAVSSISPLPDAFDHQIMDRLERTVTSVVRGTLTVALIQGVLTGAGFALFGIPHATIWGTVAVIAALVPSIGTGLVIAPAVVYLFVMGETTMALGLFVWGATAVGLIDNILGPKLVGRGAEIHSFLILLSVLGGLSVFGPAGFLLGPVLLSLIISLSQVLRELASTGDVD